MEYTRVIDERGIERTRERETTDELSRRVVNGGHALGDVLACHEHHEHPVDAVAMQALRSRPALFANARLDSELMTLHVPRRRPELRRREAVEHRKAQLENRMQRGIFRSGVENRLEPAFDAAIQRVVVTALVVRLMRLAHDAVR